MASLQDSKLAAGSSTSGGHPHRRPCPIRFTVRRMMAAVAVLGTLLGVGIEGERRRERFQFLANHHWLNGTLRTHWSIEARCRWHVRMWHKYEWAGRYPWFPVEADTPDPGADAGPTGRP